MPDDGICQTTVFATSTEQGTQTTTEIISLREENVKHFDMGDGTYQAIAYAHPVHELDSDGNWQDIDFGMSLTQKQGTSVYTSDATGTAFAANYATDESLFTLSSEENAISMSLVTSQSSAGALTRQGTANAVAAKVTEPDYSFQSFEDAKEAKFSSTILYEDVMPGVDLEYIVDPGTVKENIIVKERASSYEYIFTLDLEGLYPILLDEGSILVYDKDTDEQKYEIPMPFMYDALGNMSYDVYYTLTEKAGTYYLTVTASADWINTEDRNFPVTIDPTFVRSTEDAYDTYISSTLPDSNLGSSVDLWIRENRITYIRLPDIELPVGGSLEWAYLTAFYYYYDYVETGSVGITVHKVIGGQWDENLLTWNSIINVPNYGLSTTVLDTEIAYGNVGAKTNSPKQIDFAITSTVQSWIDGNSSNHGIGLRYVEGSENKSVIIKSMESGYDYRPRITYQYSVSAKYHATVNSYFDSGYSVYYGETQTQSASKLRDYLAAVSNRYMELFALELDVSSVNSFTSPIDYCKGTVSGDNINELCSCGEDHTNRKNVINSFSLMYPGNVTTTNVYWSCHKIISVSSAGLVDENRNGSNGTTVVMLERSSSSTYRKTNSESILMHELNHQFGARDHYHEPTVQGDDSTCKNKDICSDCDENPRPRECVMYNTRQDIDSDTIICDACKEDILEHLDSHH